MTTENQGLMAHGIKASAGGKKSHQTGFDKEILVVEDLVKLAISGDFVLIQYQCPLTDFTRKGQIMCRNELGGVDIV